MRLRDGTYQADSSRPSAVSIATSWWGMPSEDSWIAQRGACVTLRAIANGITTSRAKTGTAASQPAPWASRQPSAGRRGARRGAAIAVRPAAMRRRPPAIMPTPVTSVQSGPEFTTCRPCEMTPKPNAQQADDDAQDEPRRPRDVRPGQRPGDRDGDDRQHPEQRGVGPGEREVEQVERDEREPGEQERALEPGEALAERCRSRAAVGTLGRGSVSVAVISASLAPTARHGHGRRQASARQRSRSRSAASRTP